MDIKKIYFFLSKPKKKPVFLLCTPDQSKHQKNNSNKFTYIEIQKLEEQSVYVFYQKTLSKNVFIYTRYEKFIVL